MNKIALIVFLASSLFANIGKIVTLRGDVVILSDNKERIAKTNDILEENDKIITKNNAKLQIKFIDNTIVTLGKNTTLNIKDYVIDGKKSKVSLEVNNGHFKVISGNISKIARKNFEFQAKTATIGIRGTVFVGSLGKVDKVGCLEGAIDVKVGNKTSLVQAGNQLRFDNDKVIKIEKIVPKEFETINTGKESQVNTKQSYKNSESFNEFLNSKEEMIKAKQEYYQNKNYQDYKNNYKYNNERIKDLDTNSISKDIINICNGNTYCIQNKINYANKGYLNGKDYQNNRQRNSTYGVQK
ncbi:FecR family protein [Campylobacter sp. 2018MI13]|uniref:FecR family protein n=1 Tax=Campylobacter sp. 2018MI13 TaxID=2836737 RepID=UPI001BDA2BE2|nr:FecR family protein [Campylobacter sp. 2018MI13]MBT0883543.1 FecR domain-containing protein [Campylobacter sp. 2018MI13]